MDLTAIIACKDRIRNLAFCIKSISLCNPRPNLLLIDFANADPLVMFKKTYPWIDVIRVDRKVEVFHKARALNIGIRYAKDTHICLTDADQIFQPNFFGAVRKELNVPNTFAMCDTAFLPVFPSALGVREYTNATYAKLYKLAKRGHKRPHGEGCCHAVARDWLLNVQGLDERYIGWGFEDKDLVVRAGHANLSIIRLEETTSMVHLPHGRDKIYFNKYYRLRNEKMYLAACRKKRAVANKPDEWGNL